MTEALSIRFATREDVPIIFSFIKALADYEKLSHEVVASESDIDHSLFGAPQGQPEVILARLNGKDVGFALFFHNYSTFLGRKGIYLEDLFVLPEYRGKGVGKNLLSRLAAIAVERDCGRLEWSVLDWNTPSIEFYKSLHAEAMDEWTVYRLTGDALKNLSQL
ncbi:GNAT family N-acetyltransferase [Temperatibacter marinus]|uniref:GNAT family N-acetyltransferase n=1 Tax=Temperatibacter marinus TaxID=1456591 RepID=A0AA52EJG4_9PROT|nr:GNAT family N-acetyltransferase [Temperatibacter marinus]WND03657.1 GNAT family N-acetyltransferase [Temperatibacter marinus]